MSPHFWLVAYVYISISIVVFSWLAYYLNWESVKNSPGRGSCTLHQNSRWWLVLQARLSSTVCHACPSLTFNSNREPEKLQICLSCTLPRPVTETHTHIPAPPPLPSCFSAENKKLLSRAGANILLPEDVSQLPLSLNEEIPVNVMESSFSLLQTCRSRGFPLVC